MGTVARVNLESAYVLHTRPYRETSLLLEVFSHRHGRVGMVARGAQRPSSPLRGLLQSFRPLAMSWAGAGDLVTLRAAEPTAVAFGLKDLALLAGFYTNELILKLLHRGDPHPELFAHYTSHIINLSEASDVEPYLRQFEMELLREIGYGLNLTEDAVEHKPLVPEQRYEYRIDQGPVAIESASEAEMVFDGSELLAIARCDFSDAPVRRSAKKLMRYVVDYHLGGKPLNTRRIFRDMQQQSAAPG
jgi:DNA repair protein RecO (recombination protein O)